MDIPRHPQPFTLAEAIGFDVSVIMEGSAPFWLLMNNSGLQPSTEINRLENSLKKLGETQEFLQSYVEATPDAEIARVFEENKVVM
jgi:hypothetical protein